jgi:hypothetical protein
MKDRPHCAVRQHAAHLVFDPLQKRLDVGEVDGLPQGRQLLQHGAWTAIPVEDFPARHRMVPRELRAGHRFAQSAERRKPHEVDASREAVESFARQGRRGQIRPPRGRAVAGHRDCEDRGARPRGRWRSRFFCSGAKVPRASPDFTDDGMGIQ